MDKMTKDQRSHCMSQIKSKNTKPEIVFRKAIWEAKIRGYRLSSKVIGKPDLFFPKIGIAVFIDGCFWHKCPKCFKKPKSEQDYWNKKIKRNVKRDAEINQKLCNNNIRVLRFWEHDIRNNIEACVSSLQKEICKKRK